MRLPKEQGVQSWTEAPADKGGAILVQYARALEARMDTRIQNWEIYSAVYSEQLEAGLRPSRHRYLQQPTAARNANLTFNVGRSLVETEHATITEAMPRPTFLTDKGNRMQQDKAKELQFLVDGIFSDLRAYETFERAETDKCVLGTGCVKIHRVGGRPAIDRVLISDILVDEDLIGSGRDPQQIIHRNEVSRKAMLTWFKDASADVRRSIVDAPAIAQSGLLGSRLDMITVYDSYSAPLDEDNPGRHAIAIENCEEFVYDEPWLSPRLPFVFMRWQRPTTGFYGIGIIEQILGIQVEINRFYRNVSLALRNWGVPTGLVPTDAKINLAQWTNDPRGKLLPYQSSGGTPTMFAPTILSPEVMNWLQFQIDTAYKVTGIPQNVAFAQKEAGIPSAQGQRELSQKASSRLAPQSKEYERCFVDAAWRLDDIVRELRKADIKLVVSCPDEGALHPVDIDEAISLEPGSYHIDIFAGNFLSRHPAAKREEVQELAKAGVFTPAEVKALLPMPDVEAALGKPIDVRGLYADQIQKLIRKGVYQEPEAFWPQLEMGVSMYADALFEGLSTNVPEDRLQIMRDWIAKAHDIMEPPAAPAPAPDAAAPPPPAAAPQAPAPAPQPQQQAA